MGAGDELFGLMGVDILKSGKAIMKFDSMTLHIQ